MENLCIDQSFSSLKCRLSPMGYNTYTLKKGTILYHGSSHNITCFNHLAYFTMHRNIAQSFIFYLGRLKPSDARKPCYLYTLKLNQDVSLLEHDMYKFSKLNKEFNYGLSSPLDPMGKKSFCTSAHQGWIAKRDVASLPLLTRKTLDYSDAELMNNIIRLNGEEGIELFYHKYCRGTFENFDELNHEEWIDSLEFVLCNASKVGTIKKIKIDANKILSSGRDFVVDYLTSWIGKSRYERAETVKSIAYEWFLSHIDVTD